MADKKPPVERESGYESWSRLNDGLIAGVHHAINNRMGALSAVSQVLEADLPAGHPLAGALREEIRRLEAATEVLRLLITEGEGEPVQVETVVGQAKSLVELHHSLRDLELEIRLAEGLYPLWIDPAALRRALAILVAVAGRRAASGDRKVTLAVTGTPQEVQILVTAEGNLAPGAGGDFGSETEAKGLDRIEEEAAGALLERWWGKFDRVDDEGGRVSLRITLPTLPEARRREAGA
jgi:hypothetical protein